MRKLVVLIVALAALGFGAPADAATTIKGHTRTDTTMCIEGGKVASVTHTFKRKGKKWYVTKLTAKNPCPRGQWLFITSRRAAYETENCCATTAIEGGVKFTWNEKRIQKYGHGWHLSDGFSVGMDYEMDPACEKEQGYTGTVVDENGKVWWGGVWRAMGRCY